MTTEPESARAAAPAAFKRTELQHFPSPNPGWEIAQSLVEIPEGIASGRHNHPGPEVGYIVRGDVAMEFDERPTLTLHTGDPFMIPPGVIHNARIHRGCHHDDAFYLRVRRYATPHDPLRRVRFRRRKEARP
jgi:quercetin dioxygenase-like cupin family protein